MTSAHDDPIDTLTGELGRADALARKAWDTAAKQAQWRELLKMNDGV